MWLLEPNFFLSQKRFSEVKIHIMFTQFLIFCIKISNTVQPQKTQRKMSDVNKAAIIFVHHEASK